jgi:ribosomal small subunit protein bTHX
MGKGDQRTKRGKIYRGTFGKRRKHRKVKHITQQQKQPAQK